MEPSVRRCFCIAVSVAASASCKSAAPESPQSLTSQGSPPAVAQILDAFDKHRIVMLGEEHQSAPFYEFATQLVRAPRFAEVVNDIVLESGNVRYQAILDRYMAGEDVPRDSLVLVWRNTTQLLAWDSPLYEGFLKTIREVNSALPRDRRVRVLVGDPPIDWSATNAATDIPRSYGYRDWQGLAVLEQEVLARGRRALVIIGGTHLYRHPAREGRDMQPRPLERAMLGDALNRKHPGIAYLVQTLTDREGSELVPVVAKLGRGQLVALRTSPIGAMNGRVLFGRDTRAMRPVDGVMKLVPLTDADFPPLADEVDALLYLGKNEVVPPPRSVYDANYLAEIRRRIKILTQYYGADIWTDALNELVGAPKVP